ncbi:DUF6734 family protein [Flavobacterium sp. IMCC34518]|uniref:DUF6734 family protein n=1 Tax=Flavobacterium sp. IMCC34518 TaxID=3003623 RepID=UPI0022AC592E|nr:DUF6734 family protein [Flavobacterium sp. IMCC34518]
MKVVYTFYPTILSREWIKPDFQQYFLRKSIKDALRFYSEVYFYTNDAFAKQIKDIQGIHIIIQEPRLFDKELWALPKIFAYEAQNTPFLFLDLDVILGHQPEFDSVLVESIDSGAMFKESYRQAQTHQTHAFNMGVYGCKDLNFNAEFCKKAHQFIADNYEKFAKKGILRFMPIYFEQLMLAETLKEFKLEPKLINNPNYVHLKNQKWDLETYNKILNK